MDGMSRDGGKRSGRVRGIGLNIWIRLFLAVVCKYLSTGPSPEFRSLFPSLAFVAPPRFILSPLNKSWTGPANTISAYDSSPSRPGCVVLGVRLSLSVFFWCFSFSFLFFFLCGHGMGSSLTLWLAGSRSTANRPTAHRSTARHRQGSQKPPIAVTIPAASHTAPSTATSAPTCATTRVVRPLGHFHAHSSRLRHWSLPPEPVLLHVR